MGINATQNFPFASQLLNDVEFKIPSLLPFFPFELYLDSNYNFDLNDQDSWSYREAIPNGNFNSTDIYLGILLEAHYNLPVLSINKLNI